MIKKIKNKKNEVVKIMNPEWVHELYKFLEEDQLKLDPAAEIFPKMSDKKMNDLIQDIEQNGQLVDIDRIGDSILDGVHRYFACKKIGVRPKFKELNLRLGMTRLDYALSKNVLRRDLNSIQCVDVAVNAYYMIQANINTERLEELKEGEEPNSKIQKIIAVREINLKKKIAKKSGTTYLKLEQGIEIYEKAKSFPKIAEFWQKAKDNNLPMDQVYNRVIKPENSKKTKRKRNVLVEINELKQENKKLKEKNHILNEQTNLVQDKYSTLLQNLKDIFEETEVNQNLEINERFTILIDKIKELIFKRKKKKSFPSVADRRKAEIKLN